MARKIYVTVTTRLIINADDDQNISDVLSEMDYDFTSNTDGADIEDAEILNWEVTDSK